MPFRDGKGSKVALKGIAREQRVAVREHRGSIGKHRRSIKGVGGSIGKALERSKREEVLAPRKPDLAALYSAITIPIIYPTILPGSACCYLYILILIN